MTTWNTHGSKRNTHTKIWYGIAASILLVVAELLFHQQEYYTELTERATAKTITLPDGTSVQQYRGNNNAAGVSKQIEESSY
ncbi:hypothetical protein CS542_00915 [Pedobacter sp. IW39]|nr:hypothetical protein CS542_00915 [Pedobacter sp. IW39]